MSMGGRREVFATDLTPINVIDDAELRWMESLSKVALAGNLLIPLGKESHDDEPIVSYHDGAWWAGRYVGEIQYNGRRLVIEPRYPVAFERWLQEVWGVRTTCLLGRYMTSPNWIWQVIGTIWANRLSIAAIHGLPFNRYNEPYFGQVIRGRIDVGETAEAWRRGKKGVVSRTVDLRIDIRIGSVLLSAYSIISRHLRHIPLNSWMPLRTRQLITQLGSLIPDILRRKTIADRTPIQYRPIHEQYRSVVELSQSLLRQDLFRSTSDGNMPVTGVLVDIAEVWERYLVRLLTVSLPQASVRYEGRNSTNTGFLFVRESKHLGGLRPDIVISHPNSEDIIAIIDAKYKQTSVTKARPNGVEQSDLYQIHAYLHTFGNNHTIRGALVYPFDEDGNIMKLQGGGTWASMGGLDKTLSFFALSDGTFGDGELSQLERIFVDTVREWL